MATISNKQLKNIYVFFGFFYGKYKKFVQVAVDLGGVIAKWKLDLVYGGSQLYTEGCQRLSQKLFSFEEAKCYVSFQKP